MPAIEQLELHLLAFVITPAIAPCLLPCFSIVHVDTGS